MDLLSRTLVRAVRSLEQDGPQAWSQTDAKDSTRYRRYHLTDSTLIRVESLVHRAHIHLHPHTEPQALSLQPYWHVEAILATPGRKGQEPLRTAVSLGLFAKTSDDLVDNIAKALSASQEVQAVRDTLTGACISAGLSQRAVYWMPETHAIYDAYGDFRIHIDPLVSQRALERVGSSSYFEGKDICEAMDDGDISYTPELWSLPFVPCAQGLLLTLPKTGRRRARLLRRLHRVV